MARVHAIYVAIRACAFSLMPRHPGKGHWSTNASPKLEKVFRCEKLVCIIESRLNASCRCSCNSQGKTSIMPGAGSEAAELLSNLLGAEGPKPVREQGR